MNVEDILLGTPITANPQFKFEIFTRCYSSMAKCRNDIWRTQSAAFAAGLDFNDKLRDALRDSENMGKAMATQQKLIREYAETVQEQAKKVLQLWFGAWGSLSELLVPVAVNEALAPLSAAVAATPVVAEASNRFKTSLKSDGKEDGRRANAA